MTGTGAHGEETVSPRHRREARQERAIQRRYGEDAPAYARFWAPMLCAFSLPLLDAVEILPGERAIDAGCGTGDLAFEIARRTGPAGFVAGIDLTAAMLAQAKARGLLLASAGATALPFRDASFDFAVSTFVLHHVREQKLALREMRRVLGPAGRAGIAVWGRGDMDSPAFLAWSELLDRFDAPEDPDPPRSYESRHDTPRKAARLLMEAGFVRVHAWKEVREHASEGASFEEFARRISVLSRRLHGLDPPRRTAFLEEAAGLVRSLEPAAFTWRGEIVYAAARVA